MKKSELATNLCAVLFVATGPLSLAQLAIATESPEEDVAAALEHLKSELAKGALRIIEAHKAYELVTAPALTPVVERFLGSQVRIELSRPALETLAIIVYRQPVTKMQIEEIRGIASDQTLKTLLQRDLITEAGHSSEPGKPTLYRPSHRLLHHLGLNSFDELSDLETLSAGSDAA